MKINNLLKIETCAHKICFFLDFGYFCSFFNKILGFYGKTEKIEIGIIISAERGRRARSGKINNILEIESCADKKRLLFQFWVFLIVF